MSTKELQVQDFPKRFPCGEIHVRVIPEILPGMTRDRILRIEKRIQSSDDIMEIFMLVDAVRRQYGRVHGPKLGLSIPYVPYSRQDRVMVPGESLSIKVFADMINSLKFDEVVIWDPHSDVTPVLIDNCKVISQEYLLMRTLTGHVKEVGTLEELSGYVLICPDAGARKKILKVANAINIKCVIYADKQRDLATGKILGTTIDFGDFEFKENTKFLIVDDICDGGRTFVEIAKALSGPMTAISYTTHLHVTHGFFTKGLDELFTHFDSISCANLMNPELAASHQPGFTYYTKV